ncbi:MAG: phenylpropionate dioxygenase-like ring-hydroxylating dioxygenase large terminal subunit [Gammaproteobacteria bacterium]|jgi:phenylpropionate dioxygenase-like ring-hydroxylating dioxygenase large terminal subunit
MNERIPKNADPSKQPYSGYYKRTDRSAHVDIELTHCGPQTPMGEYMRRFWQPVCMSEELTEVPKAIRIMNEDLVAFRDRSGRVGVLDRHCCHRGTSLEYGIIQQHGIRCCYHGWQFDVDGSILETPCEPAESQMKDNIFQGAYPAFERHGLVFAYMGPPEEQPEFEEFDAYTSPADGRLVPFTNVYACNWLQVSENLIDHFHAATLHNNMTVANVDSEIAEGVSLGEGFRTMPVIQWEKTRDGNGMLFSAGRRIADDKVWIRITEMTFPNFVQTASVVPTAAELRHTTVGLTRWHVPVDDHNMIIFGWRHFNDEIDPKRTGDENECGIDKVDFLIGQTNHRSYYEGQLAPGDYEAITSIGKIAPHGLEHPARSDVGVYMCRNLLRAAIRGETPPDSTRQKARGSRDTLPMYSADSVLNVARAKDGDDDDLLRDLSNQVVEIMRECDSVVSSERKQYATRRLNDLDGGMPG